MRGRPTDYNEDLLEKAGTYLMSYTNLVPSLAGLAKFLSIHRSTVYDWMKDKDKKEFSDICSNILAEQELKLTDGGLGGTFNATITKLMLTKHGYSDKQEHKVDGTLIQKVERTIVDPEPEDS